MWTSRSSWLRELSEWAESDVGRIACQEVNVRAAMLIRVAEALAAHADHLTGRHCAVTNGVAARIARCCIRTVRTVRGVLRDAGMAVEARRGTGSAATPGQGCRASVWHFISVQRPVDNAVICRLPPSRRDRRLSPVLKNSPSGRARPPRGRSSKRKTISSNPCPRPLHTQQLAAGLVARSRGLSTGHIGHICDVLTRSHLDLPSWTAQKIKAALEADMRARGTSWPDVIRCPAAFLATRLRYLPTHPPGYDADSVTTPGNDDGQHRTPTKIRDEALVDEATAFVPTTTADHRRSAKEFFRLNRKRTQAVPSPTAVDETRSVSAAVGLRISAPIGGAVRLLLDT